MELGRKIYYTRIEKNMTLKSLAKKIGVSTKVLDKWENCELYPNMKQVDEIAKALKLTVPELLDNDIRNLIKEEEIIETKDNNTSVDLLKIVGVILLGLILLLIMFYL